MINKLITHPRTSSRIYIVNEEYTRRRNSTLKKWFETQNTTMSLYSKLKQRVIIKVIIVTVYMEWKTPICLELQCFALHTMPFDCHFKNVPT